MAKNPFGQTALICFYYMMIHFSIVRSAAADERFYSDRKLEGSGRIPVGCIANVTFTE
ncbi:hypothetical protein [Fluviicola sp.]|uniref:hypothetical protein n=1 Tax=Fluviicola sp. TaxID=1917219 RepID=UPI0031D22A93